MIVMKSAMLLAGTLAHVDISPAAPVPAPSGTLVEQSSPAPVVPPREAPQQVLPATPPVETRFPAASPPIASTANEKDVVVVGKRDAKGDPLIAVNAKAFGVTQAVDTAVVGPVSLAYKRSIPAPIRSGIHNFLYNLREPIVFVNYLLQFKVGKAAETAGRFAINSTVGAAGLIDIAKRKPFRLPRRSNGFANTLGFHGVKNGPFLFLPLVGPTTLRDLLGGAIDRALLPVAVGKPFTSTEFTVPAGALGALDHRAEFDGILQCLHDDSADPYTSSRNFYLQRRQAEIDHLKGRKRKVTPRCETVGFGIGSTPPASATPKAPAEPSAPLPPVDGPPSALAVPDLPAEHAPSASTAPAPAPVIPVIIPPATEETTAAPR